MDTLEQIHARINAIETDYAAKAVVAKNNRDAAIKLVHFILDTISKIAPRKIESEMYGSYTNPGVSDYPRVTIYAKMARTHERLAVWVVDTGGRSAPQKVTAESILEAVNRGLAEITETL